MKKNIRIEQIVNNVKSKLNIDLENYRNDDLVERFTSLIAIHSYFLSSFLYPLILSIFLLLVVFFVFHLSVGMVLFVGSIGTIWLLFFTLTSGLLIFTNRVKSDLSLVLDSVCKILSTFIQDVCEKVELKDFTSEKMLLLVEGFLFGVISPSIAEVVRKKIPFFKNFIADTFDKMLLSLFTLMKLSGNNQFLYFDDSVTATAERTKKISASYIGEIRKISENASTIINKSMKMIQSPIRIAFAVELVLGLILFFMIKLI